MWLAGHIGMEARCCWQGKSVSGLLPCNSCPCALKRVVWCKEKLVAAEWVSSRLRSGTAAGTPRSLSIHITPAFSPCRTVLRPSTRQNIKFKQYYSWIDIPDNYTKRLTNYIKSYTKKAHSNATHVSPLLSAPVGDLQLLVKSTEADRWSENQARKRSKSRVLDSHHKSFHFLVRQASSIVARSSEPRWNSRHAGQELEWSPAQYPGAQQQGKSNDDFIVSGWVVFPLVACYPLRWAYVKPDSLPLSDPSSRSWKRCFISCSFQLCCRLKDGFQGLSSVSRDDV